MQLINGTPVYAATDLVGFLACGHLTALERAAVWGHEAGASRQGRSRPPTVLLRAAIWIDQHGQRRTITWEELLIVAPYNAQVGAIRRLLPVARVGTVDKFQGQEAPISLYVELASRVV